MKENKVVSSFVRKPMQEEDVLKCNCAYCHDGRTTNVHDKKFIAEAVAIRSNINFKKLPNLYKALSNEGVNKEVWLELVFLIKEVIETRCALTEIISHATISLIKSEWQQIAAYLEKYIVEYTRLANKTDGDLVVKESDVWKTVIRELESCVYVIGKGLHWRK